MKKITIEYAVQKHDRAGWHDIDIYNQRNCHWDEPIGEWPKNIMGPGWLWGHYQRKHSKLVRLVKRTTVEEICK